MVLNFAILIFALCCFRESNFRDFQNKKKTKIAKFSKNKVMRIWINWVVKNKGKNKQTYTKNKVLFVSMQLVMYCERKGVSCQNFPKFLKT